MKKQPVYYKHRMFYKKTLTYRGLSYLDHSNIRWTTTDKSWIGYRDWNYIDTEPSNYGFRIVKNNLTQNKG